MEEEIATQLARHLQESLVDVVQAAILVQWQVQAGDWCTDVWSNMDEEGFMTL